VIRMGRQHTVADEKWTYIRVTQDKTGEELHIPILPELTETLALVPREIK